MTRSPPGRLRSPPPGCYGFECMHCPSEEELARLSSGELSGEKRAACMAHLESCDECRSVVAHLARGVGSPSARAGLGEVTVGRYRLEKQLGVGASSVVYEATDPQLGRRVCLKLLRSEVFEGTPARFLEEARTLAKLRHPNVVTVYDAGTHDDGRVYLVLELVEGGTFGAWLADGKREVEEVLSRFVAAGEGLAAAHRAGVVHRDFKPSNVLLDAEGRARVADFGLAHVTAPQAGTVALALFDTQTRGLVGTPAYMAPEQLRGERANARSDQYAFCVTLYEALQGQRPFAALTLDEVLSAMKREQLSFAGTVPKRVRTALERGLRYEPRARFESMDALLAALKPRVSKARYVAAAIALSVLGVAGGFALTRAQEKRAVCANAGAGLELRGTLAPELRAPLDDYAKDWRETAVGACVATRVNGVQSDGTLAKRGACLERARQRFDAVLNTLSKSDAPQGNDALALVRKSLSESASRACSAMAVEADHPPLEGEAAAQFDQWSKKFAEAQALRLSGRYPASRAMLDTLLAEMKGVAGDRLRGEVLTDLGAVQLFLTEDAKALDTLRAALIAAQSEGNLKAQVGALAQLIEVNRRLGKTDEAIHSAKQAEALLKQRPDAVLAGWAFLRWGGVEINQQHYEQALDLFERAYAAAVEYQGANGMFALMVNEHRGICLERLGRGRQGLEILEETLHKYESENAQRAVILGTVRKLGIVHLDRGEPKLALEALTRAVALASEEYGPRSQSVAELTIIVGNAYSALSQEEEALAAYEKAATLYGEAYGPQHPQTVIAAVKLAIQRVLKGDAVQSVQSVTALLEEQRQRRTLDDYTMQILLFEAGRVLRAVGQPKRALVLHEEAFALAKEAASPQLEAEIALDRLSLGQRERARMLAEKVLTGAYEPNGHAAAKLVLAQISGSDEQLREAVSKSRLDPLLQKEVSAWLVMKKPRMRD